MKRFTVALLAMTTSATLGLAQDVPFGEPRIGADRLRQPTLSDLMTLVQVRHIKLWFAGKAQNWDLLQYEVRQIGDALSRSALLYSNIPVELVVETHKSVQKIGDAARDRNSAAFEAAYGEMKTACNSCHAAAGIAFIRVQPPTLFPFTDQALVPPRAPAAGRRAQ